MAAALEFFGTDATGRFVLLGLLIASLLLTVLACKVAGKTGFHPALGLITLIPLGLLIYLAILALAAWPALGPVVTEDDEAGGP